jgi:RND family efflux transporter MFP subunit
MRPLRCTSCFAASLVCSASLLFGCKDHDAPAAQGTHVSAAPTVSLITATESTAQMQLTVPATIVAFNHAALNAQVAGYLDHIYVDVGSRVRKGQMLLTVRTPELAADGASAMAALQSAHAAQSGANAEAAMQSEQTRRLAQVAQTDSQFVAGQDLDNAQARAQIVTHTAEGAAAQVASAQAALQRVTAQQEFGVVRAPFSGVVTARSVDPGTLVHNSSNSGDSGTALLTIDSTGTVRVVLHVPDNQAAFVHAGQVVQVHVDAFPSQQFSGTVTRISSALDPMSRTMEAEVDLPNRAGKLRTGMFGTAILYLRTEPGALFLPSSAIHQDRQGKSLVYVVQNGEVHPQAVVTSLENGVHAKVDGLQAGQQVVLGSSGTLAPGMRVNAHPATAVELDGVR